MKYYLAIDLGGTTFNAGLFDESYNLIHVTSKDKIRNYNSNLKDKIILILVVRSRNVRKIQTGRKFD